MPPACDRALSGSVGEETVFGDFSSSPGLVLMPGLQRGLGPLGVHGVAGVTNPQTYGDSPRKSELREEVWGPRDPEEAPRQNGMLGSSQEEMVGKGSSGKVGKASVAEQRACAKAQR